LGLSTIGAKPGRGHLRTLAGGFVVLALTCALTLAFGGPSSEGAAGNGKRKAPKPVPAWSVTARDPEHLRAQVANYARAFAERQNDRERLMLLSFGAVRTPDGRTFGTAYRPVAGGELVYFPNRTVLNALERGADAYKRHRRRGSAVIAYGTTNYKLANPSGPFENMSPDDAQAAGRDMAGVASDLRCYQRGTIGSRCPSPASGHRYRHQRAALAGDIEMNWEHARVSRRLVKGAADRKGVHSRYYDYGTAGGCASGPRCNNGWTLGDVAQVSFGFPAAVAMPEIYYRSPDQAADWARVQRHYNRTHAGRCPYRFHGVTGTPNRPLTPSQGWERLQRRSCGRLGRELINIHLRSGGGGKRAQRGPSTGEPPAPEAPPLGSPIGEAAPASIVADPSPFFSSDELWPLVNAWGTETRRRLTAVQAGGDPYNPSVGVLGIFRQNFVRVRQTAQLVRIPGTGPLEITDAPEGQRTRRSAQRRGLVEFRGAAGITGTLDLADDTVALTR
jgi:hypothetical protein